MTSMLPRTSPLLLTKPRLALLRGGPEADVRRRHSKPPALRASVVGDQVRHSPIGKVLKMAGDLLADAAGLLQKPGSEQPQLMAFQVGRNLVTW